MHIMYIVVIDSVILDYILIATVCLITSYCVGQLLTQCAAQLLLVLINFFVSNI